MDLIITARDLGHMIYDVFTLPGEIILSRLLAIAPGLASLAGIEGNDDPVLLPLLFALLVWLILLAAILRTLGWLKDLGRALLGHLQAFAFRCSLLLHNMKRRFARPLQLIRSWRQPDGVTAERIDFNDLDVAILRTAIAQPPGIAVSAPELADHFRLRPSQVQRSLDRLTAYRMLESVIGSTDGFDNYRLTPSGTAFISAMG